MRGRALGVALSLVLMGACRSGADNASGQREPSRTTFPPTFPPPDATAPQPLTGPPAEPSRVRVVVDSLELSEDRTRLSVTTFYPARVGHCIKNPDGVHVAMDGGVAVISAWMRSDMPAEALCTLECAFVTQAVTLDDPLPNGIAFASPDDAYEGCARTGPGNPTTTTLA